MPAWLGAQSLCLCHFVDAVGKEVTYGNMINVEQVDMYISTNPIGEPEPGVHALNTEIPLQCRDTFHRVGHDYICINLVMNLSVHASQLRD